MGKNLGVERIRFEAACGLVAGAERKYFSGIGGADENCAIAARDQAGDLGGSCFCDAGINVVAFQFDNGAFVSSAEQNFAVRGKAHRENQFLTRSPKVAGRAFRRNLHNVRTAGGGREKGEWRGNLRGLRLDRNRCGARLHVQRRSLLRSNNGGERRGRRGVLLFADGSGVDLSAGVGEQGSDLLLIGFVEDE